VSDRTVAVIGFALVAALVAVFLSAAAIVDDHFQAEHEASPSEAESEERRR